MCVCVCIYIYSSSLSLSLSLFSSRARLLLRVLKNASLERKKGRWKKNTWKISSFSRFFFSFHHEKTPPPSPCPSFLPGKTREIKQHERTMSLSLASWYVCSVGQRNISVHALVLSFSHPLFFCVARFLFDCSRACCVRACNAHHPYPIVLFALSRAREQIKHDDG